VAGEAKRLGKGIAICSRGLLIRPLAAAPALGLTSQAKDELVKGKKSFKTSTNFFRRYFPSPTGCRNFCEAW
jgi:hypothetical protein